MEDIPGRHHSNSRITSSTFRLAPAVALMVFTTPFPRLVGLLLRCHAPELLTDLLVLVHRQIFLLDETQSRLRRSLACRGGAGSNAALRRSLPLGAAALLVHSLSRASRLESGLAARGSLDGAVRFPHEGIEVKAASLAASLAIPALLTVLVLCGKAHLGL